LEENLKLKLPPKKGKKRQWSTQYHAENEESRTPLQQHHGELQVATTSYIYSFCIEDRKFMVVFSILIPYLHIF